MKFPFLLSGAFLLHSWAMAVEITVSTMPLSIPPPADFVEVTPDMKPFHGVTRSFVPAKQHQYAFFIPQEQAKVASQGQMPVAPRSFNIQVAKSLIAPVTTIAEFQELKGFVRKENETLLKQAEAQIPGLMQKLKTDLAKDFDLDLSAVVNQIVPLPPHDETPRSLAYASRLVYHQPGTDGKPTITEAVVTTTFVHVRGKVLILYSNAEKEGMEWSQTESKKWADAIIAANPSTGHIADLENRSSQPGVNWSKLLITVLIGALAVGALFFLARLMKKRKPSGPRRP